jgi:glucose-6-phosphate dehydrogenase assembly protein OpcA
MAAHLMVTHVDSATDVAAIRDVLRRSRALPVAHAGADAGVAFVATLNFIVFVDDAAHRPWVLERASRVAEKHPSRLIVLDATNATNGVDVAATIRDSGGVTVIHERVDVGIAGLSADAIASLTEELAVPEVPAVLWWSGRRVSSDPTFARVADRATIVLVDSSGGGCDAATIRDLGVFRARAPRLVLRDLAFMRLAPWQETIAQFFDDPALREDLFSITALTIESGSEAEGLYLAGWLGSRLSWEPSGRDRFRDAHGAPIAFTEIVAGERRRVRSVALAAGATTYRASLSDDDASVVCLEIVGERAKRLGCVPLQNIENTALIERAFLETGRDEIYETSLRTVCDILG